MICVECGAEQEHLIDGSCATCFTAKTPLLSVPDVIEVELCAHCNARHVGNRWVDTAHDMPLEWVREDAVRAEVRVHEEVRDPYLDLDETVKDERNSEMNVQLEGRIQDVDVEAGETVVVRQKKGACDRCSRMHGNYFAAIIQLRATERDVSPTEVQRSHRIMADELHRQQDAGNRFAFLSKDGPIHGGWDYYVGDIEAARGVCRVLKDRLGATVQESPKLVGRREGEDVYRVTFLVRIRLFASGDLAAVDDERPVLVHRLGRGKAICTDLVDHRRTRVPLDQLTRLGGKEVLEDAVVVSRDAAGLQVLDPEDYKTREVLLPPEEDPAGDSVPVLRYKGQLYIVPSRQGD